MGGLAVIPPVTLDLSKGAGVSVQVSDRHRHSIEARLEASFSESGARVEVEAPLELRGPFLRDGLPGYYLRNVTAGIFAGDSYQVRVTAEAGTTVRIGATSATKVHAMPEGSASSAVGLIAEAGSTLAWGPHTTILQAESRLHQSLTVTLQRGARAYLAEVLVLGRIARGEYCAFSSFESDFVIQGEACKTLYEERYVLTPGPFLTTALAGYGVVVSVYSLGEQAEGMREALRAAIADSPARAGVSTLPNGAGLLVRGLASSLSEGLSLAERCFAANAVLA